MKIDLSANTAPPQPVAQVLARRPAPAPAPARAPVAAPVAEDLRAAAGRAAEQIDRTRQAIEAALEANRELARNDSELSIEFDDSLGRSIFTLVDVTTGEVVRQIPSEAVLAVARALADGRPAGSVLQDTV